MAQINALITQGFGSFAGVKYIVTEGFLGGSTPPPVVTPDTHDYVRAPITAEQVSAYRKKMRREEQMREDALREKLENANSIRLEIDRILHPPAEDFEEKIAKAPPKPQEPPPNLARLTEKQRRRIAELKREISALTAEAEILKQQAQIAARRARQQLDEQDMRLIQAMMNANIQEILGRARTVN